MRACSFASASAFAFASASASASHYSYGSASPGGEPNPNPNPNPNPYPNPALTLTLTPTPTLALALTLRCPALNGFLSLPLFDAPAKITYAAYLVHPILIRAYYFQARLGSGLGCGLGFASIDPHPRRLRPG